jgi:hypothetical protein
MGTARSNISQDAISERISHYQPWNFALRVLTWLAYLVCQIVFVTSCPNSTARGGVEWATSEPTGSGKRYLPDKIMTLYSQAKFRRSSLFYLPPASISVQEAHLCSKDRTSCVQGVWWLKVKCKELDLDRTGMFPATFCDRMESFGGWLTN